MTEVLKVIDLNHPSALEVAHAIVKPLELLSKVPPSLKGEKKEGTNTTTDNININNNNNNNNNNATDTSNLNDSVMEIHPDQLNQAFNMEMDLPLNLNPQDILEIVETDDEDDDENDDDDEDDDDENDDDDEEDNEEGPEDVEENQVTRYP